MLPVAEIFGAIAVVFNFIGYRQSDINRYRFISAIALLSVSIHFFLLGAMAAGVGCMLACIRNIVATKASLTGWVPSNSTEVDRYRRQSSFNSDHTLGQMHQSMINQANKTKHTTNHDEGKGLRRTNRTGDVEHAGTIQEHRQTTHG